MDKEGEYCIVGKSVRSIRDRTDTVEQLSSTSRDSDESLESSSVSATISTRLMVCRLLISLWIHFMSICLERFLSGVVKEW